MNSSQYSEPAHGRRDSPRPFWLIGLLAWTGLILFASSTIYISGFRPLGLILQVVLSMLLPLALLTPLVFWTCWRFPLGLASWPKHWARHLVTAVGFCFVSATISTAALVALQPQLIAAFGEQFAREFPEAAISKTDVSKSARMFLPPTLRSAKFDPATVLLNAFTNLPPYCILLIVAHAISASTRLREREQQAAELAASLARARLDGLRTQLQPHFLFNTLNSISALIPQNARLANEMVLNLSDLLRMTLREPERGEISLGEELKLLGHYVDIQKLRFGERLDFRLDAAEATWSFPVPPLLLQPLVENAIRYGVEPSDQPEKINLRAWLVDQALVLEITNTCGTTAEEAGRQKNSTGLGLANTRARLTGLYGDAQSLQAHALPEGGFRVEIRIAHRETLSTRHEN